jgi:septal ring factor EnvC (AmiA/AmiB activator)
MPTSDQELAELQTTVEEKRQRLVAARLEREAQQRSLENDVTAAQLRAEEAKLDQLIAEEEARNARVEEAAAVVIDPQAAQAAAELAHEAAQDQVVVNTTSLPEGSTQNPDGTFTTPDGQVVNADGSPAAYTPNTGEGA